MKNKKMNLNLILVLICIFLCVCIISISIIIPNRLIKLSNREIAKEGDSYKYEYEEVFYAKIERIEQRNNTNYNDGNYNGIRYGTIYVNGLDINDINHRGKYSFSIDSDIKFFWKHKEIKLSDLKEGQTVAITSIGYVYENLAGYLTKVARVTLLDDEL